MKTINIGKYKFSELGLSIMFVCLFVGVSHAISTPSSSSTFAYDVYEIGVNQILKGPIGFVGGVAAIVFGAMTAIRGAVLQAVPALLGGGVLLKADTITETFGAVV